MQTGPLPFARREVMRTDYGKFRTTTDMGASSVWYRIGRQDVLIAVDFTKQEICINAPRKKIITTMDEYDEFVGTLKAYVAHMIKGGK